ncbi:Ig-like domain-containing protein [Cellulophaga omnivescoria]|uniref:Ig-like domain-containing protein n=1 Tax=Cellulophaga omnivescoria TaxID=1888890 RepID=UPI0009850676|nr:Ig-like domain-containing protein [Cellulophaga omnivescoria]WBU90565.1 Ig-like domain-containing protein [Cellulophaga omnivescoria]
MKNYIYIILLFLFCISCGKKETPKKQNTKNVAFTLITSKKNYTVSDSISLEFSTNQQNNAILVLKNAYGITAIKPKLNSTKLTYKIPSNFTKIVGNLKWLLVLDNSTKLQGTLNITPETNNYPKLETYLGPRSIVAGGKDFSMLVNAPTDRFDNPLQTGTKVAIKHQFKKEVITDTLRVKNLVAWTNIFSPQKTGRILITSLVDSTKSKELTTVILPDNASNFTVDYSRNHKYADGNQIITFTTSTIKDNHGNVVSDGTLVLFTVKDSMGNLLQTNGTTINGVAIAKLLHPSKKESWTVTAYVTGAAKSDPIMVDFSSAIKDYKIQLSTNNRIITIGPIESFMQQFVPDGLTVTVCIYTKDGKLLNTIKTTSLKGIAKFNFDENFYKEGTYNIKIEAAGIIKNKVIMLK